jgi:cobalt-zinc-cadmium efflux system protein
MVPMHLHTHGPGGHRHGGDGPGNGAAADARALDRRLWLSTALNAGITVAEIVGGVLAGSLALLADALHNLGDVAALIMAIVARRLGRRPASARYTYGLKRAEVFAALLNAATLLSVSVFIATEALRRLREPAAPQMGLMLGVAGAALAGNVFSVLLLRGRHGRDDLNVRSAVLHLVQDALASLVVIVAALFAHTPAGPYLDPVASLVICGFVLRSAFEIVREAVGLLAERVPRGLDVEELGADVAARFAPARLHHVHVWEVGPGQRVLTAHLAVRPMSVAEAEGLCADVRAHLHERWGIEHATLEPEVNGCGETRVVAYGDGGCGGL